MWCGVWEGVCFVWSVYIVCLERSWEQMLALGTCWL
jgi:hypothetical protein